MNISRLTKILSPGKYRTEGFLFILIRTVLIKEEAKVKFVLSMYRNVTGLI